jgi:hypothetical protein
MHLRAHRPGTTGIAAGLFLDHPFDHAVDERHTRCLDHLQVARRQQIGPLHIGRRGRGVVRDILEAADALADGSAYQRRRIVALEQGADGRGDPAQVEYAIVADRDHRGAWMWARKPDTADQCACKTVGGEDFGRCRVRGI